MLCTPPLYCLERAPQATVARRLSLQCFIIKGCFQVWEAHKNLNDGIASGEVQPLPWTVYSRDRAQEAFRFLAGGVFTAFLGVRSDLAQVEIDGDSKAGLVRVIMC